MAFNLPMPGRRFVIGVPYVWLFVFFLLPFLILLYISFVDMGNDISPFKPIWDHETGLLKLKYENYWTIFVAQEEGSRLFQTIYIEAYLRSIWYALATAVLCLLIGYPFSYFIARSKPSVRPALLMMVMLPFWTSFLLRVYAWKGILADQGVINQMLMAVGLISEPIQMLYTDVSLLVGMTYVYLPFMVLPLYANLVKMDFRLLEAAYDLGSTPLKAFWLVTVPLSKAGIIAGFMLVFIPCVGEFVIPSLLGGPENIMIGRVVWDEMFTSNNWPRASALAVVMIGLIVIPLAIYYHYTGDAAEPRH
ncbi:ABC transporter permease [Rhodoferax antarcticus]|uniref:Binding--dependent transport system inner membrane component family protein n=1 Tax=Rhodoferax antarcticus ANT.BR TaxID=1111071 RepID=A0A1Q8YBR8_9BURK|nr:ABC transporter permease [Rhodoferax antarcticus]APW46646.1 putrescine ABC transporter permease PotH [Rhodoferax antarcticus]MCW2313152.1 putrescine transport system permease protein [Rhodoferax antarcticus]OLP05531.1 binding--dependent transport system inner membrane component family protein [Rhodoferax antarcticus ANT.BR]